MNVVPEATEKKEFIHFFPLFFQGVGWEWFPKFMNDEELQDNSNKDVPQFVLLLE